MAILLLFLGDWMWAGMIEEYKYEYVGFGLDPRGLMGLAALGCWGVSISVFIMSVVGFANNWRAARRDRK